MPWAAAATAAVLSLLHVGLAGAFTSTDRAAAIVVYPKIVVDSAAGIDTIIQLVNADRNNPVQAHCFYVNANNRCSRNGQVCRSSVDCSGQGTCVPGWSQTDFNISLTRGQPFSWIASAGRNSACAEQGTCESQPSSGTGVCISPPFAAGFSCSVDAQCGPGGVCFTAPGNPGSNAGTSIPGVGDDPFRGELKCVEVNGDGSPATRGSLGANDFMGVATIVSYRGTCSSTTTASCFVNTDCPATETCENHTADSESYNAIGIQTNRCSGGPRRDLSCSSNGDCPDAGCERTVDGNNVLVVGGPNPEYQPCPTTLILDHVFDGAPDPLASNPNPLPTIDPNLRFVTDLTLVPCSEDFNLGSSNIARSSAHFLVFNEFEQRYSANRQVNCFDEVLLSNIDTRNNARSIFSVGTAGTIAGQTRIQPTGSGLLGVARVMKAGFPPPDPPGPVVFGAGAAYNLRQSGERTDEDEEDLIILP